MKIPKDVEKAIETARKNCKDPYLKKFPIAISEYGQNGLRAQIFHIINNMHSWDDATARKCKKVLKKYVKIKKMKF